jgi:hypothetical protein
VHLGIGVESSLAVAVAVQFPEVVFALKRGNQNLCRSFSQNGMKESDKEFFHFQVPLMMTQP